jgi:hypothetical protein
MVDGQWSMDRISDRTAGWDLGSALSKQRRNAIWPSTIDHRPWTSLISRRRR